ncbi:hypothetical protein [Cognatazoarcus halotolerans]|uniref:hypothetical protein n=1 Tax=Cognatazoarcus halotolerans TaxID=2686016 RepID=UPI00135A0FAC|nr:hypothetical protein [Cognatazoarcus halotolerans]MCB1897842.1 hypothetical protein [Rhodocyclaceae bacterium]MCP5311758.1 hypothetical protein [Zoogloeaceae bacterium]
MNPNPLYVGALTQVLTHWHTGCPHAAHRAADLLDRLADDENIDAGSRALFDAAGEALRDTPDSARTCA